MKNYILLFSLCLLIWNCKEKTNKNSSTSATTDTAKKSNKRGSFRGVTPNKTYEVEIDCDYFEHDYFLFKSDILDIGDSNGDGLNISGFQVGDGLQLDIADHGVVFGNMKITTWEKGNNSFKGTAILHEDDSSNGNTVQITFTGNCN